MSLLSLAPVLVTVSSALAMSTGVFASLDSVDFNDDGKEGSRVLNAIVLYDDDHFPENGRPDHGWWPMNPNHPGIVPKQGTYRTGTSLLGLYDMKDERVLKQHAYWMGAAGINAVLLDWTNLTASRDPDHSGKKYCDTVVEVTERILRVYRSITEFASPRVVIAIRMPGSDWPESLIGERLAYSKKRTDWIADQVHDLCSRYPNQFLQIDDGSADRDKPLLVVFPDFRAPGWKTGPLWADDRFNCRYMNGYLIPHGLATAESDDWNRVSNDLPYWDFIENMVNVTDRYGYYKTLYRRLPCKGTFINEQAAIWVSMHRGRTHREEWDGQLDLVDGKTCLERTAEPLFARPPRNLLVCRWNYPIGWFETLEGLSWNYSAMIEPSKESGFSIYYNTSKVIHDLRKLPKTRPGKPVVTAYDATTFSFTSSNYPIECRVSAAADGADGSWNYVDINNPSVGLPGALHHKPFYLVVRNAFGESEATYYQPIKARRTIGDWTMDSAWRLLERGLVNEGWVPAIGEHFDSTASGAEGVGRIQSRPFRITGSHLSFYAQGHELDERGLSIWADSESTCYCLKDAASGKILVRSSPSRAHIWSPVIWDVRHLIGHTVIFEAVDENVGKGKAWLRFTNPVQTQEFTGWTAEAGWKTASTKDDPFGRAPGDTKPGFSFFDTWLSGQSATGRISSAPVKLSRPFVTFHAAGYDGADGSAGRSHFCLKDARTGALLRHAGAPGMRQLAPVKWDVRDLKGRLVVFEAVDGNSDQGFAWISFCNAGQSEHPLSE